MLPPSGGFPLEEVRGVNTLTVTIGPNVFNVPWTYRPTVKFW